MLNLKKTAVAVLAFGSSAVFAGSMGPVCAPGNVTVPCASTAWDFGVQALYLKPSLSSYGYNGSEFSVPVGTINTTERYNSNPYNWGWGFKLEGSYHFNTGNDLNLNWYHLDHKTNSSGLRVAGPLLTDAVVGYAASSTPKWDAVNLEFGQLAHFGEMDNIRFHGGLQYAHIQGNISATGVDVTTLDVALYNSNRKYDAVGPRIGADYAYSWGNGLAMYANGASALLVGNHSFTKTIQGVTAAGVAGPVLTETGSVNSAIVPELEAKLGATYTYAMAQGDLSLDIGWMWVNYFNALSTGTGIASGTGTAAIGGAAITPGFGATKETNFAVQGPFIGLKWVGNVA